MSEIPLRSGAAASVVKCTGGERESGEADAGRTLELERSRESTALMPSAFALSTDSSSTGRSELCACMHAAHASRQMREGAWEALLLRLLRRRRRRPGGRATSWRSTLPEGSPTEPVAPPTSATGTCPQRWNQARTMIPRRFPCAQGNAAAGGDLRAKCLLPTVG